MNESLTQLLKELDLHRIVHTAGLYAPPALVDQAPPPLRVARYIFQQCIAENDLSPQTVNKYIEDVLEQNLPVEYNFDMSDVTKMLAKVIEDRKKTGAG